MPCSTPNKPSGCAPMPSARLLVGIGMEAASWPSCTPFTYSRIVVPS